jgi:hypothetical protein
LQPNCLHDNSALTQSGHAAGWGSHSPTCDPHLLAVILAAYGFSGEKRADSNLPTHTLELLHKRSDLLKHRLLLGEVLRVQRAHLGQHSIQFRSLRLRWLRGLTNQA